MTVTHRKRRNSDVSNLDPTLLYHCDKCSKDISGIVRIKCAVCRDFDLCVECFASGAELQDHKSDHPYTVQERLAFPLFVEDWGADEELLLIEGCQLHGLGNWVDIADHVGTKTWEECESHYLEIYIDSSKFPLPDITRTFSCKDVAIRRPNAEKPPPPKQKILQSLPANHEIQGYMPGRQEFETEMDNDAEALVKDLVFLDDDTKEERELKLSIVDIYNSKLQNRAEKRKVIINRGLLEYKKNVAAERRKTKEERELHQKLKVFARMLSENDYEEFVKGLTNELNLRMRIAILQEYRRNGIQSLKEADIYERDKMQRESSAQARESYTHRYLTGSWTRQQIQMETNAVNPVKEEVTAPSSKASTPKVIGRKPANPLDIQDAEGYHLLTPGEQHLCSTLRLYPKAYLVIKDTIIREYTRVGSLKRRQARALIKIDVNKTGKIYDFFVEMGWIKLESMLPSGVANKKK